ncbi:unnamed protein product [Peniophora sp. CBMAI 1063]|nr:unnamed protein product [Peniophora sp. CBMAI 1063]
MIGRRRGHSGDLGRHNTLEGSWFTLLFHRQDPRDIIWLLVLRITIRTRPHAHLFVLFIRSHLRERHPRALPTSSA